MKYGRIAGNDSINSAIYRCFDFISEADVKAYVKKFAKQPHDQDQVKHTLRELIVGVFLASHGLTIRSEQPIDGKTPDWSILENGSLKCLVEVVTFHTSKETKDNAMRAEIGGVSWTFMYQPDHTERIRQTLQNKSLMYKDILINRKIPYVIGLYLDFDAAVNPEQFQAALFDQDTGIFAAYPYVSGVLVFDDMVSTYRFTYFANPNATRPFPLAGGKIDFSIVPQGHP
jgi:hypothetical protein